MTALHLIIGTLQRMHAFGVENRDTLTHKATGVLLILFSFILCCIMICFIPFPCAKLVPIWHLQYSAKLLKKPDQCRAVYACSHLFWTDDQEGAREGERCVFYFYSLFSAFVLYMKISNSIVSHLPPYTLIVAIIAAPC